MITLELWRQLAVLVRARFLPCESIKADGRGYSAQVANRCTDVFQAAQHLSAPCEATWHSIVHATSGAQALAHIRIVWVLRRISIRITCTRLQKGWCSAIVTALCVFHLFPKQGSQVRPWSSREHSGAVTRLVHLRWRTPKAISKSCFVQHFRLFRDIYRIQTTVLEHVPRVAPRATVAARRNAGSPTAHHANISKLCS